MRHEALKKQLLGWGLAAAALMAASVANAQPAPGQGKGGGTGAEAEISKIAGSYPFAGSSFMWWQSVNAIALNPGAEQTHNPTYSWMFRLWPRLKVTDWLRLALKLDVNLEVTNSDDTTKYREAQLGDTWLDFNFKGFKEKVTGISITPNLRLVLPTSKALQARSRYVSVSPAFSVGKHFDFPNGMDLSLGYNFRWVKHFDKFTTVQFDTPSVAGCGIAGIVDCGRFLHTGVRNPTMDFWNIFSVDWGITSKLHFSVMFAMWNSLAYDLTNTRVPIAGGNSVALGNAGDVGHRAAHWYYFDLSYQFHPAFSAGLGISTFNMQLADDSTYRTPFFNRFTELALYMTVSLDAVVAVFDPRRRTK